VSAKEEVRDAVEHGMMALAEERARRINLENQIKAGLDKLRAAASGGPVTSREIFSMTDPLMDILARAQQEERT
jgi:hypothetical protein